MCFFFHLPICPLPGIIKDIPGSCILNDITLLKQVRHRKEKHYMISLTVESKRIKYIESESGMGRWEKWRDVGQVYKDVVMRDE